MEEPGQRLKRTRERLNLKYRDVEEASNQIASRHRSDEFIINLSRLSDIENKGTVPSVYRLYSLCTIYRLDINEVLEWYGVTVSTQPADAASIHITRTHPIGFGSQVWGEVHMPVSLDPGFDIKKTTLLSRMIQRWGKLPVSLLNSLESKHHLYAFVGTEDWSMFPIIYPESLVLIDDTKKKITAGGWTSESDRPIYFVEHRGGYVIGWCSLTDKSLIVMGHPSSNSAPLLFPSNEVDILGQVIGIAMLLDTVKRPPGQS